VESKRKTIFKNSRTRKRSGLLFDLSEIEESCDINLVFGNNVRNRLTRVRRNDRDRYEDLAL
jgi:hypothetical protein